MAGMEILYARQHQEQSPMTAGEMKHTPGPWVASAHFAERKGGRTYIPVLRPGNDPVPLAVVHRDVDGYGRDEGEANARLIARAPDLLEALRGMLTATDHWNDWEPGAKERAAAQAAIAKATGSTP